MGDTEETVANQVETVASEAKEVIEIDKEDAQQQPGEGGAEKEGKKRKAMAPRSDAWNYFTKVKTVSGEEKAKCKYCDGLYKCDAKTNGTSSLNAHLKVCRKNPNKKVVDKQGTLQLMPSPGNSSVGTISTWKFDLDELKICFAEMLIEDEQPFAAAERPGLRKFMAKACPKFDMPSRRTATRNCVKVYDAQKLKLQKFLKEHCERVSLTTDTWTANTKQNYMCVTAHFLDKNWNLHKKIIGFFPSKGHGGEDIGKHLESCLASWGIDKVFTITVDNASANNNAINYMRRVLNESKGTFAEGDYLHMRCVAHIINLIVTEGLKEIDTSVARVRAAVKYIKGGTSRLVNFKKCAELAKVQTKAFLNLDVCTRWNSTYLMLNAAQKYEKAFQRYSDEDPYYRLELENDGPGVPVKSDWEKVRKMSEFLEHFYELTLRVSATKRPTSHTFFHEIADVLVLLRNWSNSEDRLCQYMGKRMLVKYDKYFGEKYGEKRSDREKRGEKDKGDQLLNLVVFFCVAIDPRYKLSNYIKMAVMFMFGAEIGEKLWGTVNTSFRSLFEEYKNMYAPTEKVQPPNDSQESQSKGKGLMRSLINQQMSNGGENVTVKSEIEKYFAEDNEEDKTGFDILKYWKVNENRFPVLSIMARDLLAIPISTVASESAFSTGGRILDDFRSSLTSTMVERLICASDWIRGSENVSVEENTEELAKLEEGKSVCLFVHFVFIPIHY